MQASSTAVAQENPFLKKHVSTDENMMTFNEKELRANSPINKYSPQSKKEILEQDEYQTEPRVREESQKMPSYIQEYEQRINFPSKALNFIRMNNQILSKYSEESRKDFIVIQDSSDSKPKDGNDSRPKDGNDSRPKDSYFTNNDISPVKNNDYYEESLETIRSDFEPNNPHPQHSQKTVKPK